VLAGGGLSIVSDRASVGGEVAAGAAANRRTYAPHGEKRIEEGTHTETKGTIGERHDDGEPEKAMGRGPNARRTGSSI
jgi:hypothetical protein